MLKDLKTLTWSEQLTDNYLRSSVLLFLSIKVLLNGLQIFSVLWGNWKGSKRRNRWDNFVTWKTWKHYKIKQNEIKKKFSVAFIQIILIIYSPWSFLSVDREFGLEGIKSLRCGLESGYKQLLWEDNTR